MKTSVPSEFCLIIPPSVHSLLCLFFLYNAFLALSQSSSELYPWRNFLFFSHTWISWLKCFSPRYIKIGVMELCHYGHQKVWPSKQCGPQKSVALKKVWPLVSKPCRCDPKRCPRAVLTKQQSTFFFITLLSAREWFLGACNMSSVISLPLSRQLPIYSPSISAASSFPRIFSLRSSTILSLDIMLC